MSNCVIEKNTTVNLNDLKYCCCDNNFTLEEASHAIYICFDDGTNNNTSNKLVAHLRKDASLEIYNVVTSSNNSNILQQIYLEESGANVNIMNLFLMTKESSLDSLIEIFHSDKHTESNLSNYAISKDNAKITMSNNASIKQGCSKSIAHQQAKGLTLSKASKIKALPNLFIDEYDVVANHACSIGSINKEDLFYLMSRGLTHEEASKIVVMGYVKPLLDNIKDETLKENINKEFENKLLNN